jgi:hypothetical protein
MALVYFVVGAGTLCCIARLRAWAKAHGRALGWYHWLGVGVVAAWTLFTAAWVGTSLKEGMATAAGVGALLWGGIGVLLFVLLRLWIVKPVGKKA